MVSTKVKPDGPRVLTIEVTELNALHKSLNTLYELSLRGVVKKETVNDVLNAYKSLRDNDREIELEDDLMHGGLDLDGKSK